MEEDDHTPPAVGWKTYGDLLPLLAAYGTTRMAKKKAPLVTYICAGYVHRNGTFWEMQDVTAPTLTPEPLSTIRSKAPPHTDWVIFWDHREHLFGASHLRNVKSSLGGGPVTASLFPTSTTLAKPIWWAATIEAAVMRAVLEG